MPWHCRAKTRKHHVLTGQSVAPPAGRTTPPVPLLDDLCDHAGAHGTTAFANRKTQTRLHGNRSNQLNSHRSEEHTSELQSRGHLVCRLLLEKKHTTRNA